MPELSAGTPTAGVEVPQGGPTLGHQGAAANQEGPSLAGQLGNEQHAQVGLNLQGGSQGAPLGRAVGGTDFGQPSVGVEQQGLGGPQNGVTNQHSVKNTLTQDRGPGKGVSPETAAPPAPAQQPAATQPESFGDKLSKWGGDLMKWIKENPGKAALIAGAAYALVAQPWSSSSGGSTMGGISKIAMVAGLAFGANKLAGAASENSSGGMLDKARKVMMNPISSIKSLFTPSAGDAAEKGK